MVLHPLARWCYIHPLARWCSARGRTSPPAWLRTRRAPSMPCRIAATRSSPMAARCAWCAHGGRMGCSWCAHAMAPLGRRSAQKKSSLCPCRLCRQVAAEVASSVQSAAPYVGGSDPTEPRISPVFTPAASLAALPPTLLVVGDAEVQCLEYCQDGARGDSGRGIPRSQRRAVPARLIPPPYFTP